MIVSVRPIQKNVQFEKNKLIENKTKPQFESKELPSLITRIVLRVLRHWIHESLHKY